MRKLEQDDRGTQPDVREAVLSLNLPPGLAAELVKKAATGDQLNVVVDVLSITLESERFATAATAFATTLATKLGCDRVAYGVVELGRVRVQALSHSATFSLKTNLVQAITGAMEETLDQRTTIAFPPLPTDPVRVTRAHEVLSREFGARAILSIPLIEHGLVTGVLTLERGADQPFDRSTVDLLEAVGAVSGPVLEVKRRDDRLLAAKTWESLKTHLGYLVGPRHVGLKVGVLALLALIGFMLFATGEYRVSAKTLLEGAVQRAAVAPFKGYLETAPVRAGDVVREGQVLATLQERDLKLERIKWMSQQEQFQKEYRQAMAERDAPKVEIITAQLAQTEAQLALATDRLSRTQIAAPFSGIVVTGDWSQQLGAPVEEGKVLFEIAPLDAYRLVVEVDERDITPIAVGQTGRLVLSSLPDEAFSFKVSKITPVSTARDGRNFFRVEGQFDQTPPRIRPAMEGVAKIEIDRRQIVWIWTHQAMDWARLKLWAWLP